VRSKNIEPIPREEDSSVGTRGRLLEAAGEVFAEQGFRAGTIREICGRAEANIAAVNYHFGDKEGLYRALLAHAYEASLERHPPDHGVRPGDPPCRRLHAFVRSFLLRLLDDGRAAWHTRLMCREINDPSPFLGDVVRGSIGRVHGMLKGILRDVAAEGPQSRVLDEEQLTRCAMSVAGQCLHYRLACPVLEALYPGRFGLDEVASLADHITAFSVAGIRGAAWPQSAPAAVRGPRRSNRSGGQPGRESRRTRRTGRRRP
jgi:AcrR family transcriptional regulator